MNLTIYAKLKCDVAGCECSAQVAVDIELGSRGLEMSPRRTPEGWTRRQQFYGSEDEFFCQRHPNGYGPVGGEK